MLPENVECLSAAVRFVSAGEDRVEGIWGREGKRLRVNCVTSGWLLRKSQRAAFKRVGQGMIEQKRDTVVERPQREGRRTYISSLGNFMTFTDYSFNF